MLFLLFAFVFDVDLLDDVLLFLCGVQAQVGVTECALADYFEDFVLGHYKGRV